MTTHGEVRIPWGNEDGQPEDGEALNRHESLEVSHTSDTGLEVSLHERTPGTAEHRGSVEPFKDQQAAEEAMSAENEHGQLLVNIDPQYRAEVEKRLAASVGDDDTFWGGTSWGGQQEEKPSQDPQGLPGVKIGTDNGPSGTSKGPRPFSSVDQLVDAQGSARYRTDPDYRAEVDARIAVTSWL